MITNSSIPKRMSVLAAALLWPLASPVVQAQSTAQYEAVFSDGTRVEGEEVFGWHEHPGSPRLDKTPLLDAKRPLLWLRDRTLKPWKAGERCRGYIEFAGGDRLVGRVLEGRPAGETDGLYVPAHLLVKRAVPPHRRVRGSTQHLRALPGRIRRVVFGPVSRRPLRPGTLYYRDGRRLGFLRLRWRKESVLLLLKDGTRDVDLSEIAELHPPRIDPWQAYYEELAVLSPSCRSRLVRLETTGGMIATGSWLRFRASAYGPTDQQQGAVEHLKKKNLDEQIARIQTERKANQLKLEQARANYRRQLAASEKQKKAEQQAYQKATTEMRQRIDELRKKDAAEWAKRRQQLEQELRAADQAMQERLAKAPPEKRESMLKTFREKQSKLRKTREKSLKDERLRVERWQKELNRFINARTQELKQREKELQDQVAAPKRRFEEETARWEAFLRHLESVKLQRKHGDSDTWSHILQPVWSLDALRVPFRDIHTRWSFAPEQVPLCRVRPASAVSPPLLPWYTNRNSAGGPLRSGGRQYAWGFGVHAYSELRFPLPECASAFRSRIGLDRIVGPGGCARARVYVGSTGNKPAYEGPVLVGSKKTADTGRIRLQLPSEGPRHLVLQVDPAHDNRPPGADPLNIRDKLDWLDPRLELDAARLQDQVRRQVGPVIAAAQGWTLALDRRGVYTWTSHLHKPEGRAAGPFLTMLRARGQPLRLSREMTIGPADKWLAVHMGLPTGENPRPDAVALRVGQRQIRPRKVPIRQLWQSGPAPLLFPLDEYQGKKVTLDLTQPAGGKPLHWQAVSISAAPPPPYRLVDVMASLGESDTQVSRAFGRALLSGRMGEQEMRAALAISRLGGVVNFKSPYEPEIPLDRPANVLVGKNWKGGDKTFIKIFTTLKEITSLKTLLVTNDSGVSRDAMARARAQLPGLTVKRFARRVPSAKGGPDCQVTWRNLTHKEILVLYITRNGGLQGSRYLKPGQEMKRPTQVGHSYEAHYLRWDHTQVSNYASCPPLATHVATPGAVWEIKPPED